MSDEYYIGCDVGTGSVRAGVFDPLGKMLSMQTHPIKMWKPQPNFVEQSSDEIWSACCLTIKKAVEDCGVAPNEVKGIGFDATCSLVVLDENAEPLSVSPDGSEKQNIIVWMDHRAIAEAEEINSTGHEVLKYVGGKISPEMETPKLSWLKKHKPETWKAAAKFFDLPDFLVYKATGTDVRSICTTTCKWTYLAHESNGREGNETIGRWDDSFFKEIGLSDLVEEQYNRIGQKVRPVGEAAGSGLCEKSAEMMGLQPNTSVGVAIIDAHAGGLGLLGMEADDAAEVEFNLESRIALIGGTSSCHMAVSSEPKFIDGVWGPYYSAMIPDMWLTEGGQSATGALIDHIIFSSKQSVALEEIAEKENKTVYQILNERIYQLAAQQEVSDVALLTKDLHILPYFHGNRSPRANPSLLGSICGLKLSSSLDDLALLYLAAIQAIAYGTRHIIEALNENGYAINKIMATGGGTKNPLFLKEHADICRCQLVLPEESEAVLLGSAILGSVAAGTYPTILDAMKNMNRSGKIIHPQTNGVEEYHHAKYEVFHKMYHDEISYFDIMGQV